MPIVSASTHAQVDRARARAPLRARRRCRDADRDGVEERLVAHVEPTGAQAVGEGAREPVHPLRDRAQAVGTVVHRVHAGDVRQQHLRGADVAGGLLATDVLLARLQREAQRAATLRVDRHADQAAGQVALVLLAGGEERGVRSAVGHRHAEALRRADDDVGAPLPRRGEEHQREQVGGDRDQRAVRVQVRRRARGRRGPRRWCPGTGAARRTRPRWACRRRRAPRPPRRCRAARRGSARRRWSAGGTPASTKKVSPPLALTRRSMVIASAAAVASSSSDALARSMAVRSLTMVWKLRSASSRPWEISGWYGV